MHKYLAAASSAGRSRQAKRSRGTRPRLGPSSSLRTKPSECRATGAPAPAAGPLLSRAYLAKTRVFRRASAHPSNLRCLHSAQSVGMSSGLSSLPSEADEVARVPGTTMRPASTSWCARVAKSSAWLSTIRAADSNDPTDNCCKSWTIFRTAAKPESKSSALGRRSARSPVSFGKLPFSRRSSSRMAPPKASNMGSRASASVFWPSWYMYACKKTSSSAARNAASSRRGFAKKSASSPTQVRYKLLRAATTSLTAQGRNALGPSDSHL
mmetsp:Transcript_149843/g.481359  ORF Transcript_149843/g.481359 Transcript_149843/m.481359 type:complete len:268 (+) Transcript_149843:1135-1938(+)